MIELIKHYHVTEEQSAKAVGSGSLLVLATPSAIAMVENTCMLISEELTKESETSVGTAINFNHLKASLIGAEIKVVAQLVEEKGRKLEFTFEVFDQDKLIANGSHTRFIVEIEKFLSHIE
ncbi:thioesterase family protein [Vagococcus fluvialis]|uniref:thioesterase family protein n=1 Tax=Vagococcus fluvialis TaxID=2738 RepID=UPI002033DE21|nr:hotdog domain-containing protein [Vagococcus fluvialis]MCM2137684.1 diaminopimelate epimerase [Vagococcus fluvialis]